MRINTDRTPLIHQRYAVKDLPTLVFLTRSGLYLARYQNANRNPADKILASMKAALEREPAALAEEQKLVDAARTRPTPERWKALGDYYAKRQGATGAIAAYKRSYQLAGRASTIAALARFCLRDRQFEEALAACELGLRKFGRTPDGPPLLYYKGLALVHGVGDRAGARSAWRQIVERYPHNRWARSARKMLEKYEEE